MKKDKNKVKKAECSSYLHYKRTSYIIGKVSHKN